MIYSNIWGRDALFCFSGLEGVNTIYGSMCGQLLTDKIGASFDKDSLEVYISPKKVRDFTFRIVSSDIILGDFNGDIPFGMAFVSENTMVGFCPTEKAAPFCNSDFLLEHITEVGRVLQSEEFAYAFVTKQEKDNTYFALSRHKDMDVALRVATESLATDWDVLIERRLAFYDNLPNSNMLCEREQNLFLKCCSVMKSQVYTPEGIFKQRWTTPDRLPHKKIWLWDSVYHSIGNVHISPELAYDTLLSVLDMQQEDGRIPIHATPDGVGTGTQPPILAWGFLKLYEKTKRLDWLEPVYEKLKNYLEWNRKNRDTNGNDLYEWYVEPNTPLCRCGESGMDNSPRFDNVEIMDATDFSCYMANDIRCMKEIAKLLGYEADASAYDTLYQRIAANINSVLYDEADGLYYDRENKSGKLRRVKAVSCFLPLFAGVCSEEQAKRLVEELENPETFGTPMKVPSIALNDETFGTDMWRGPVWINFNYMIISGLCEYGYMEQAEELRQKTIDSMMKLYEREGCIFEFYDCMDELPPSDLCRKGHPLRPYNTRVRVEAIRDYGWSSCLLADLLMQKKN